MFVKFHERLSKEDKGFTLIELLVVVLIIAILAAIAIPVFLQQRKKGWRAQIQSSLKNAATAEESFSTANNGAYTLDLAALKAEGFSTTVGVDVVSSAPAVPGGYCLTVDKVNGGATAVSLNETWQFDSTKGAPQQVPPAVAC